MSKYELQNTAMRTRTWRISEFALNMSLFQTYGLPLFLGKAVSLIQLLLKACPRTGLFTMLYIITASISDFITTPHILSIQPRT